MYVLVNPNTRPNRCFLLLYIYEHVIFDNKQSSSVFCNREAEGKTEAHVEGTASQRWLYLAWHMSSNVRRSKVPLGARKRSDSVVCPLHRPSSEQQECLYQETRQMDED